MRKIAAILICLLLQTGCTSTRNTESAREGAGLTTPADAQLQQLRQRHNQARATFAETQDYGEDYQESKDAAHALISALLNHWMTLPEGSAEAPLLKEEIRAVFKETAGSKFTEQHNTEKSFLARTVWPLLANSEPTREQAVLMAEMTKPQMGVRMYDKMARAGQPTEPLGWDVQAAHTLALIRSGKAKEARDEISILHDKVSINNARNPKGSLDYGPEAGEARYRNYTDYLQLCQVLHALQAAIANDHESAQAQLENARKLRETLSTEAAPLVAEVDRRIKADSD